VSPCAAIHARRTLESAPAGTHETFSAPIGAETGTLRVFHEKFKTCQKKILR
jgi:hypothetical protein